ncbi:ribose-5-phosphate isomerase RpiA [Alicyclobacillus fastidiosus]|uniref:Ribose-5-phosphate isomerase A n=1 Tax=Alicyclobacillus fastidiosus TaxID=392011 RepID=A0ABY6ZMW9_9BACL|nr:ribose-5-phosphate isomerase RpiA [Alicyclobacillus fastidiosus]WAH44192.1 ribose-5-phosphate isomerase RpiA [Alicyclobacillus fastidiosus]GMA60508.1 ribose-5-phosphate isomerase A [Alicyclobacillus fastidiosus]
MASEHKRAAGERALDYVKDGMVLGLGTGSTVYYTLQKLGRLVQEGLKIQGIPTSKATEEMARELNIPLTDFVRHPVLDLTIDGADAVTPKLELIKGGGGALLREKLVASASKRMIVIIDESKQVDSFDNLEIPVEVIPFAVETTVERIRALGGTPVLRERGQSLFVTDNGHYIVDVKFPSVTDVSNLHDTLKRLTGVVETGLFPDLASHVIVGTEQGVRELGR